MEIMGNMENVEIGEMPGMFFGGSFIFAADGGDGGEGLRGRDKAR
jgi:hypothetical protein